MKLFRGSTLAILEPRITNRRNTLDFGTGFYLTSNEKQAREFAIETFHRRGRDGVPTVSVFEFNLSEARKHLSVLEFDSPNGKWLDFVVHNRRHGRDSDLDVDVIIGPVADDDVFATIALYEGGQLSKEEAIARFKVKNLFDQLVMCNEKALGLLEHIESYEIIGEP